MKGAGIKTNPAHKGALSRKMGIPEEKNIPVSELNKIIKAKNDETVTMSSGKRVKATTETKRQANFAKNAKKWRRGRSSKR
jgi:hypothetical protein